MDRQDTLRNLLISVAIFLVIMTLAPRLFVPPVPPSSPTETAPQTTVAPTDGTAAPPVPPSGAPNGSAEAPTGWTVREAEEERSVTIGAEEASTDPKHPSPYRMRLRVSNVGASIESATMTDHAKHARRPERYELLSPVAGRDGAIRSLAIEKINVDGADIPLGERRWFVDGPNAARMERAGRMEDGQEVLLSLELLREGTAELRLTRRFFLPQQPTTFRRHDLDSQITVKNLSEVPRQVVITYRGGVGIPQAHATEDRAVDVGIARSGATIAGSRKMAAAIAGTPGAISLYRPVPTDAESKLVWAATANTYFTCTLAIPGQTAAAPSQVSEVFAVNLDGDPATLEDVTVRFVSAPAAVPPVQEVLFPTSLYIGEKENAGFRSVPEYRDRNYYFQISQGFGYCTFNWLVELMILLLDGLERVVRDYGVAIIILVLIVRALLHPITKKGQVNMVRMQQRMGEFAPKMDELKRKFGNDKVKLQQEIMKLYREHNINPASQMFTCLPMFIQLPVWAALYLSLSNNIRMRHEPFLFTWVHDLTAPDALYTFAAPMTIPLFGWHIASFNLLPILVSISMYIQTKLQPKPKPNPNMTDEQRQQQEMMQRMMPMMSIMMLLVFYNGPSGLNLYVIFSSLFGALEQWWIRKHIKQLEETGGLVRTGRAPAPDTPPTGRTAPSFLEKIQKMAEQAQKQKFARSDKKKARN